MTDKTSARYDAYPGCGLTEVILETGLTVTGLTDTLTLILADYGLKRILSIYGCRHSTDGSIIVGEAVTSAVSGGVLTITTATGNDNERRVVKVVGV